jgi:hypothetical protein
VESLPRLGRRAERRKIEVGLIRGAVVKARMRSSSVVKVEIPVLVGNLIRVAVDRESGDAVV